MKIAFCAFECVPFIKAGGLADVAGSLPIFLNRNKVKTVVFMPLHKKIDTRKYGIKNTGKKYPVPVGETVEEAGIWHCRHRNTDIYFISSEKYFSRDNIYGTPEGDYPDNAERYMFFSRAALEACKVLLFKPDILHCNDMHTGLMPAYLKTVYRFDSFFIGTGTLYTIHNLAYQGVYPQDIYFKAGFSPADFTFDKMEYYGKINFMKCGIVYSDYFSTVSPTCSREICSSDSGLRDTISYRSDRLKGILNGIDYTEWNPKTDRHLASRYSAQNIGNKMKCKADLQETCGMEVSDSPVIGMVTRLDAIKGLDLLIGIMPELVKMNLQVVILGSGAEYYHSALSRLAEKYPGKLSVNIKFDDSLARRIYAGSDFFLMPSKSEPCGLGQIIAMRYGSVPVVHRTGGLADTVSQFDEVTGKGNGFVFDVYSENMLLQTVKKAVDFYLNNRPGKSWARLLSNCLKTDLSWDSSAREYIKTYKIILRK